MLAAGAETPCFQFKFLILLGCPAFLVLGVFDTYMYPELYHIIICIMDVYNMWAILWENDMKLYILFLKISFFIYLFYEIWRCWADIFVAKVQFHPTGC